MKEKKKTYHLMTADSAQHYPQLSFSDPNGGGGKVGGGKVGDMMGECETLVQLQNQWMCSHITNPVD